jgi:hypothetical protein
MEFVFTVMEGEIVTEYRIRETPDEYRIRVYSEDRAGRFVAAYTFGGGVEYTRGFFVDRPDVQVWLDAR